MSSKRKFTGALGMLYTGRGLNSSCVTPYLQLTGKTPDNRSAPPTVLPRLAPAVFSLFPKLKTTLKDFQTINAIQENTIQQLRAIPKPRSRKHSKSGRNVGGGVLPVERTNLKVTSLNTIVITLIKFLIQKFCLSFNTPRKQDGPHN